MAEAAAAAVTDEAGTRSTSATGSRRSQRDCRRRRHRPSLTLTSAAVGTTDDIVTDVTAAAADDERNEQALRRRNAFRDRRRQYAVADGTLMQPVERLPPPRMLLDENLMLAEPMVLDRIDGLNDTAWDAGRFVAVLRQRRDLLFGVTEHDLINVLIGDEGFGGMGDRVEHTFPVGESRFTDCFVCLEFKNLRLRACCNLAACDDCLRSYLSTQVGQAIIKVRYWNVQWSNYSIICEGP